MYLIDVEKNYLAAGKTESQELDGRVLSNNPDVLRCVIASGNRTDRRIAASRLKKLSKRAQQ